MPPSPNSNNFHRVAFKIDGMSALPPKAAATVTDRLGSYGPKADICLHSSPIGSKSRILPLQP